MALYAVGQDYGSYEGQRPPLTIVDDWSTAQAIKKLFEQVYCSSIYVQEVPKWPGVRDAITEGETERAARVAAKPPTTQRPTPTANS